MKTHYEQLKMENSMLRLKSSLPHVGQRSIEVSKSKSLSSPVEVYIEVGSLRNSNFQSSQIEIDG